MLATQERKVTLSEARAMTEIEPPADALQFVTPTAVKCACQEFAVNGFCEHLVYYAVAKIQAHRGEVILSQHQSAEQ